MQKKLSRVIAIIMVAVFCMSTGVVTAFAEELTKPTIQVESVSAMPGETVQVKIDLNNNPGLASLKFKVDYDDVLTLTNVEFNSAFGAYVTAPTPYKNPQTVSMMSPLSDIKVSGNFCILTFDVSEETEDNYDAEINITYDADDIFNTGYHNVELSIVNGKISVYHGIPGDINGDKAVNNKDAVLLFQYVSDWDVEVDLDAVDCNGDGKVNTMDAIDLFRFCADWEPKPVLVRPGRICNHNLTAFERVEATCEDDGNIAYWYCEKCNRYFSNENASQIIKLSDTIIPALGHIVVIDPAVAATETSTGLTEGSHCSRSGCNKVLVKQEIIPIIEPDKYPIEYNLFDGDDYLATQEIQNPNPDYYTAKGLTLQNISVPGYMFDGWFDGESDSANKITSIPANRTGKVQLYAHWTARTYTVQFNSPLVPRESQSYTVNTGLTLTEPSLGGYNFMGWSKTEEYTIPNINGDDAIREKEVVVTSIPIGTTGNITLNANWSSKRNQTVPVSKLNDPYIVEDSNKGQIVFAYEIGTIENVPLYQIGETFQSVNGLVQTYSETKTDSISESKANTIANSVSQATTSSASWSLSNDWNEITSVDETSATQRGKTVEEAESLSKTQSNSYSLNSSVGGSSCVTNSAGYSANLTKSKSGSTTNTKETGQNFEINVGAKYSSELSAKFPIKLAEVGAKKSFELSANVDYSNYEKKTTSTTNSWSDTVSAEINKSTVATNEKNWNTSEGYSSSNSVSHNQSISTAISEVVANELHYGETYSKGGSNSESQTFGNSDTETNEYSDTITYSNSTTTTVTKSVTMNGEKEGYYRVVCAGKLHVFGIVIYDVATHSYAVSTYNIMDDETTSFIDYSRTTSSFNDNENGVLPFEVPKFVDEYVDARIAKTEGLQVNIATGKITEYKGSDKVVVIPSYISVDNHDGTFTSVKIKGIESGAFQGNNNIIAVCLNDFIEEIPNNAFKNCTSLKEIICPGVESIGNSAFAGCTSLTKFDLSKDVTQLGNNVFENVSEVSIVANNASVVDAMVNSGAKNITISVADTCSSLDNMTLNVPSSTDSFTFNGMGGEYNNLIINSNAAETNINRLTLTSTGMMPLKISSEDVTLNQVTVLSSGIGLALTAENCNLALYGTVNINSESENAMLCRHLDLSAKDSSVYSLLTVKGNILVREDDVNYLRIDNSIDCNGEIISVSEDVFTKYLAGSFIITLDTNCDNDESVTLNSNTLFAYYNCPIGSLPVLTRDYYVFDGWYTEKAGGELVTSETYYNSVENRTIYAHWLQNDVSNWVLEESVPENAQIINTKWTYNLRNYTTSSSSSMSGWTKYDTKRTSWGPTQGPVYSNPDNGKRNVWSEQYVASYTHHWKYYHRYGWGYNVSTGQNGYVWGTDSSLGSGARHSIDLTYQLEYYKTSVGASVYKGYGCPECGQSAMWFSDGEYDSPNYATRWYYQDPVYTYYFYKDEAKETTEGDPTGQTNVSNVVKYVQYRAK